MGTFSCRDGKKSKSSDHSQGFSLSLFRSFHHENVSAHKVYCLLSITEILDSQGHQWIDTRLFQNGLSKRFLVWFPQRASGRQKKIFLVNNELFWHRKKSHWKAEACTMSGWTLIPKSHGMSTAKGPFKKRHFWIHSTRDTSSGPNNVLCILSQWRWKRRNLSEYQRLCLPAKKLVFKEARLSTC